MRPPQTAPHSPSIAAADHAGRTPTGLLSRRASAETPLSQPWLVVLIVGITVVWLGSLGFRSLVTPDEGRYAMLALAMARTGDWITPRLNGLLYFEKPAFQYWMGALSFNLLGVTTFAARLWPGVAGLLTLFAVGYTGARLWGRETGIRAFALAAAMTWLIANSHFLTLDAGLTFFLTLSLCAMLLAEGPGQMPITRRNWIWLAWAAMAGAVLSKGLVGIVIPGACLVFVSLWQRDMRVWRGMHWVSGPIIFLLLCAPWFVLVSMRNPGFAEFFFIHEHFARYLTKVHRREGAWWYYLPLLLAGLFPWIGALPWLIAKGPATVDQAPFARRLLVVWSVFVLVFFSISGSKLPSYILPMFPALALLIAVRLQDATNSALRWHLLVPAAVWLALALASTQVERFASAAMPIEALNYLAAALRYGAVLFGIGAVVAWWLLGRGRRTAAVAALAFAQLVAMTVAMGGHEGFGQLKNAVRPVAALRPLIDDDTPVFSVQMYDQTLPFYLGRNVTLVDYIDEFALGQRLEPGKSIPTLDEFATVWSALPQAAALMDEPTWLLLRERGLPMRIVFQDSRRLVVVKK